MTKTFLSLCIATTLSLASQLASAAPKMLSPGVTYDAPAQLKVPSAGVTFQVPTGFRGMLPEGTSVFVLAPHTGSGRILMTADQMTLADAKREMATTLDLGGGLQLVPLFPPSVEGQRVHGGYSVAGATNGLLADVDTVVGQNGVGVAIIAIAPPGERGTLRSAAQHLQRSLTFASPSSPPSAPESSPSASAMPPLSAVRLVRYHTVSGYSEQTILHLCGDGTFRRSFNASSVSGLGSGAVTNGSSGRYSTQEGQLLLHYHDGTQAIHALSVRDNKVFLDGKRWFRQTGDCRSN